MRWTREDGFVAGAEALAFGVLVFVVGSVVMLNGWAVLDAHLAVNAAAREATRTVVEAGGAPRHELVGGADGARIEGGAVLDVVVATMAGHGKDPADLDDPGGFVVRLADDPWLGASGATGPSGAPARCARVTVEVAYPVAGIRLPFLGGWGTPIVAEGQHTEIVDPFRSGLSGRADCA